MHGHGHDMSSGRGPLYHSALGAVDFIAGSAGGASTVVVGQPLDTVKVKMQSFPHLYPNTWTCFRQTLAKDGIRRGLYAGTTPAMIANVAENSVLFCAYGFCQNLVSNLSGRGTKAQPLTPLDKACSGFLAAFFSSFTLCPTELVKCKLQALHETGTGSIGAFSLTKSIIQTEGVRGLFHGLSSTIAREMPGYFFFFGGYEFAKHRLTDRGQRPDKFGPTRQILAGGFAGSCLWISIFPFDVAKSRIQITSSREGMLTVMRHIAKTEGVLALYNGIVPTLIRTFPATGALFAAYEFSKSYLTLGVDSLFA